LQIPPILLEDDEPAPRLSSKSSQEHSVAPKHSPLAQAAESAALPEAYGTGQLLLLPKDPHSLYAHWDLTSAQQRDYRELALERKLVLRVRHSTGTGRVAAELPIEPEARHSFIYAPIAGNRYVAQLGYYDPQEHWVAITVSEPVMTPLEKVSSDKTLQFSVMPPSPARRDQSQKLTESTTPPLLPPRVSWLPSLGIDPGQLSEPHYSAEEFATGNYTGSAASLTQEWVPDQELAWEAILGEGSLQDQLSSFSFADRGSGS